MSSAPSAVHILVTLVLALVIVATPFPMSFAAFAYWAFLVVGWVKSRTRASGRRVGAAELFDQVVVMSVFVLAAVAMPGKIVDQAKARRLTLPSRLMTIRELQEPETFEQIRPFRYWISASKVLADEAVQFPATELTVGEFITAIEKQTALRHRFGHCGNGSTILWGGDCSFGLSFRVPRR